MSKCGMVFEYNNQKAALHLVKGAYLFNKIPAHPKIFSATAMNIFNALLFIKGYHAVCFYLFIVTMNVVERPGNQLL